MSFYTDTFPGRTLMQNGKEYLYFGGTAYLGLQTDAGFQHLFIENVKKYGTGYSASRKSNVRLSVYEEAETFLSGLAGSEACITLSSGYLAGQLVSTYFNAPSYRAFYAPSAHVALHRQSTENYSTFEALRSALLKHIKAQPDITPVLYFDTIDPQGQQYPHFNWLQQLPLEKIVLVADDSHGFGITGQEGGGSYNLLKALQSKALVVCGSLGKGFGIQGGVIFGSRTFIDALTKTTIFTASSPAAPCALATFVQARSLYAEKRRTLLKNIEVFKEGIQDLSGFRCMEDYPVFSYTDDSLTGHLYQHHIIVTHFSYPGDKAGMVSRIVVSAHHTRSDIIKLVTALNPDPTKPRC